MALSKFTLIIFLLWWSSSDKPIEIYIIQDKIRISSIITVKDYDKFHRISQWQRHLNFQKPFSKITSLLSSNYDQFLKPCIPEWLGKSMWDKSVIISSLNAWEWKNALKNRWANHWSLCQQIAFITIRWVHNLRWFCKKKIDIELS